MFLSLIIIELFQSRTPRDSPDVASVKQLIIPLVYIYILYIYTFSLFLYTIITVYHCMVCLFLRHILCSYYRLLLLCTWPKIIPRYHTYLDHVAACSSSHYLSKMTYFFSFFHNLTSHLYLRYAYNIKEIEKIRNCISLQKQVRDATKVRGSWDQRRRLWRFEQHSNMAASSDVLSTFRKNGARGGNRLSII